MSTDIAFSPIGMGYMLLNMVASVLERIIQRKLIALTPIDVSKTGMMLINNSVSLLLMVPVCVASISIPVPVHLPAAAAL